MTGRDVTAPASAAIDAGEVRVLGRLPHSSNYTFLAVVVPTGPGSAGAFSPPSGLPADLFEDVPAGSALCVYKPGRGERPLWDFPDGLYRREIASYRMSHALGWDIVPETVECDDAPLGPGSLQRFVDADFEVTYFDVAEDPSVRDALVTIAAFDVVVNNTDRKAGHVLLDREGRLWAIDNGLSFHTSPKLRTVIWDFAGADLPGHVIAGLGRIADCDEGTLDPLAPLLTVAEVEAVVVRARRLAEAGRLPLVPEGSRPYPWPLV